MSDGSKTKYVNIQFPGLLVLLGILFITLKLTEHIDWSWIWVLAPFWLPYAIMFGVFGFFMVFALFVVVVACIAEAFGK